MTITAYSLPFARPYIERAIRNHASLPAWSALLAALRYEGVRDAHDLGANYFTALERELTELAAGREGAAHNGSTFEARRTAARAALSVARDVSAPDIRALRESAGTAGDDAMVETCDLALWEPESGVPIDRVMHRRSMEARARCAAAIADGEAGRGHDVGTTWSQS